MKKITISRINDHRSRGWHPFTWRLMVSDWVTCILILFIVLTSVLLFFVYVNPSLNGTNGLRIGADSDYYLWFAGLRKEAPSPDLGYTYDGVPELVSIGGDILSPVMIARLLGSNILILCFNYLLFFVAVRLFAQSVPMRAPLLTLLLLVNPAVLVSILTVNKEILVLVSVAMLCKYMASDGKSRLLLLGALLIGLFGRWQHFVITIFFLMLVGRVNPLRRRRNLTICVLVLSITVAVSYFSSTIYVLIGMRSGDSLQSKMGLMLATAQDHFLYFAVVLPKIAQDLYSGAFLYGRISKARPSVDIYNTVIAPLSSLANIVVTIWFIATRRFSLDNDRLFFAVVYMLLFGVLPFAQCRYCLPAYYFLCVEIATRAKPEGKMLLNPYFLFERYPWHLRPSE